MSFAYEIGLKEVADQTDPPAKACVLNTLVKDG